MGSAMPKLQRPQNIILSGTLLDTLFEGYGTTSH